MNYIEDSKIDYERYMDEAMLDADRVLPLSNWRTLVHHHFDNNATLNGPCLPWRKTYDNIRLRAKEVSVWAGVNGHGKSAVLGQIVAWIARPRMRALFISLEMPPEKLIARLIRQTMAVEEPSELARNQFLEWSDSCMWLFDEQQSVQAERIIALLRYAATELGIAHIVIDSLMMCGIDGDDLNRQKWFIRELCSVAKRHLCHIHLVAHSRKRSNDRDMMSKFDIKGAGEISDMADNVFTLWRNKRKEELVQANTTDPEVLKQPDTILICDKQRHGEWEGRVPLWFHAPTQQFLSGPGMKPMYGMQQLIDPRERAYA